MTPHAANRLAKAESFLKQLASVFPDTAPAAAIHLAYYAMLHAATAVLLGQFSLMTLGDQKGRMFGRALSKAEKLRLTSDYDDQAAPTIADAVRLQALAADFVAYCRSLL